jgi:hypothetical protein
VAGSLAELPFRDGAFTQIVVVERLQRGDLARSLRELFRVLRPGSPFAMQELVAPAAGERAASEPYRREDE